jgi:hypothetical protein
MTMSYGYGTCRGCGGTRAATKDGRPWPHDVAAPGGTPWGSDRRLCPGCAVPMTALKAPEACGRSAHMSDQTPVPQRRALPRKAAR